MQWMNEWMNIFFDASLETSDLIHTKNQAIVFLNMADMKRLSDEDLSWLFKLVEMLSVTNNENRLMLILAPRDGRRVFIYVLKANAGWPDQVACVTMWPQWVRKEHKNKLCNCAGRPRQTASSHSSGSHISTCPYLSIWNRKIWIHQKHDKNIFWKRNKEDLTRKYQPRSMQSRCRDFKNVTHWVRCGHKSNVWVGHLGGLVEISNYWLTLALNLNRTNPFEPVWGIWVVCGFVLNQTIQQLTGNQLTVLTSDTSKAPFVH